MIKKKDILFYENTILPMYNQVYSYILMAVSDHSIAADLTQDVFEIAFKKLYQLRDRRKVNSWVRSIASNIVRAWYMQKKKQPWTFTSEEEIKYSIDGATDIRQDLSMVLVKEEQKCNLEKALWNLDSQSREILSLNLLLEIPLKQIAEDMGVNYSTLRSWKRRALKRLRMELEKLEGGD